MKKHKRLIILSVAGLFTASLVGYSWYALSRPFATVTMTQLYKPTTLASAPPTIPWPNYGQAAFSINNGAVRQQHGSTKQQPTASTAKIMTALAVLDKKPLKAGEAGPSLTLTEDDVISYHAYVAKNGSVVAVAAGEKITERQALEALLLPSANNMADTLATWAFGSLPNYVQYANQKAAQLGMKNSYFADASGFSPATVSTARELVLLGEAAKHTVVAEIAGMKTADVPVAGTIRNTNYLLGQSGIIGLKTGNTDEAGGCYLFAARVTPAGEASPVTIVGAIMGAPNRYNAIDNSQPIIAAITANLTQQEVIAANAPIARYESPWGQTVTATAAKAVSVLNWAGTEITPALELDDVSASSNTSGSIGQLRAKSAFGESQTDIKLDGQLRQPSLWWRLLHP